MGIRNPSTNPVLANSKNPYRSAVRFAAHLGLLFVAVGANTSVTVSRKKPVVIRKRAATAMKQDTARAMKSFQRHFKARAGTWDGKLSAVELLKLTRS
jgi:hypothetical protein